MDEIGLGSRILESIISPELQRALLPLKVIFIVVSLVALALVVWLFKKSSYKNFLIMDWWRDYKLLKKIRAGGFDEFSGAGEGARSSPQPQAQSQPQSQSNPPQEQAKEGSEEDDFIERKKKETAGEEMSDWQRIVGKLQSKNELKCKLALLDADRLFDRELKERGKDLKNLSNFEKIEKIKDYLERLLDKPNKGITFRNANNIVAEYKRALKEIGVPLQ